MTSPQKSPLPGVNELLFGPSGAGKTYSIRTLVDAGITPFCVFTEPGFEVLGDVPADKLHWHYVAPATQSWTDMLDMATKVNTLSYESLLKLSDSNRKNYGQFVELLRTLNNFKCDRTGETFGDVSTWGTNRAIVVDSLTGINQMAMAMQVGGKPVRDQKDWGVAQNMIDFLLQKLCTDTRAHFILIAHAERETDQVLGGSKLMVSTLGRALAPKIPRNFSDVILATKEGDKFVWSTANPNADLKNRNLPNRDNMPPSFGPVIENWVKQGGIIESL